MTKFQVLISSLLITSLSSTAKTIAIFPTGGSYTGGRTEDIKALSATDISSPYKFNEATFDFISTTISSGTFLFSYVEITAPNLRKVCIKMQTYEESALKSSIADDILIADEASGTYTWTFEGTNYSKTFQSRTTSKKKIEWIEITYGDEDPIVIEPPTILPASETIAPDELISINAEGSIHYAVWTDGNEPDIESWLLYDSPFSLSLTTGLNVGAYSEVDGTRSTIVRKRFFLNKTTDISDFRANASSEPVELNADLVIIATDGEGSAWAVDANGYVVRLQYPSLDLQPNQVISSMTGTLGSDLLGVNLTSQPTLSQQPAVDFTPRQVALAALNQDPETYFAQYLSTPTVSLSPIVTFSSRSSVQSVQDADGNTMAVSDPYSCLERINAGVVAETFVLTGTVDRDGTFIILTAEAATIRKVTLNLNSSPTLGGSVRINGRDLRTLQVDALSQISISANPAVGLKFVKWIDSESSTVSIEQNFSWNISDNTDLTAVFDFIIPTERTVRVEASDSNDGRVSITATPGADFTANSTEITTRAYVTISATPNDDNVIFKGWYNGTSLVSTDREYTYDGDDDITLTARFARLVTIDIVQPEHGTISVINYNTNESIASGDRIELGTIVTLVIEMNQGWTYSKIWLNDEHLTRGMIERIAIARTSTFKIDETILYYEIKIANIGPDSGGNLILATDYDNDSHELKGTIHSTTSGHMDVVQGQPVFIKAMVDESRYISDIKFNDVSLPDLATELLINGIASYIPLASGTLKPVFGYAADRPTVTISVSNPDSSMGQVNMSVNGALSDKPSVSVAKGSEIILTATPAIDTEFLGWMSEGILVSTNPTLKLDNVVTSDSYTASFDPIIKTTRLVHIMACEPSVCNVAITAPIMIESENGSAEIDTRRYVTISTAPVDAVHSRFLGWWDNTAQSYYSLEPTTVYSGTDDISLTARYENIYKVTFACSDNGNIALLEDDNPITSDTWLVEGSQLTVELQADSTYEIATLSVNESIIEVPAHSETYQFKFYLTADTHISASFERKPLYNIVVWTENAEKGSVAVSHSQLPEDFNDNVSLFHGENAVLMAVPARGCRFVGWHDASGHLLSSNDTHTHTAAGDDIFEGIFDYIIPQARTVSLKISDLSAGRVEFISPATLSTTYTGRSYLHVQAIPNEGYEFTSWTDEHGQIISTEPEFWYESAEGVVLTANFRQIGTTGLSGILSKPWQLINNTLTTEIDIIDVISIDGRVIGHCTPSCPLQLKGGVYILLMPDGTTGKIYING